MKALFGLLATALVLLSPMAAGAAEYQEFDAAARSWSPSFLQWLQKYKPAPENVSVGIDRAYIHAYLVPGTFAGIYSIQRMTHPPGKHQRAIRAIMDGGTGKILGFIGDHVYLLTWTKPASDSNR